MDVKTLQSLVKKIREFPKISERFIKEILQEDDDYLSILNEDVLFEGFDSEGQKLGTHAKSTERIKKRKGTWIDSNIRLLDEGVFFDSIFTEVSNKVLQWKSSDPNAPKVKYLFKRFGKNIMGIPPEQFSKYLHGRFNQKFQKKITLWLDT